MFEWENMLNCPVGDILKEAFEKEYGTASSEITEAFSKLSKSFGEYISEACYNIIEALDNLQLDINSVLSDCKNIDKKQIPVKKIKPTVFAQKQRIIPCVRNRL